MFDLQRLVPIAFTFATLIVNTSAAQSQTVYPFSATYNITATAKDITPNIEQIFVSGESTDAAYGLNTINSLGYTQTDLAAGSFRSVTDPTKLGLQGLPNGYSVLEGSGSNKLFFDGEITNGLIDFKTLTVTASSTVTVNGGEGKFEGATGKLDFSQTEPLSLELGVALKGEVKVNGTIETVPEPKTDIMPLGMGAIVGAGFLLRQRRRSRAASS